MAGLNDATKTMLEIAFGPDATNAILDRADKSTLLGDLLNAYAASGKEEEKGKGDRLLY